MPDEKDPGIISLPNVRLSFPHLFVAHAMKDGNGNEQEPKFSATFIMDVNEHGQLLDRIDAIIDRIALDEFKKKIGFKRCLRDGNEKSELDGYGDGKWFITASYKARPPVVDRMRNPITEADGIIYAGCYVNATIRLWVQNNGWGKRVNAQLRAVQFVKDGDSFGAGKVDPNEEFTELGEDAGGAPVGTHTRSRSGAGAPSGRSGRGVTTDLDDY